MGDKPTPEDLADHRCASIKEGTTAFTKSGSVDERCAGVRDGSVLLRQDGHVSGTSSEVKQGRYYNKDSA